MQRWLAVVPVLAVPLAVSAAVAQTRPRPGQGRTPEFPPPTILEYKPRSTLVVPAHLVPRAKFPVIDVHGHPPTLLSEDVIDRVGRAMDSLNLQVMVNANGSAGDRLTSQLEAINGSRYKNRFVIFTTLDLRNVGPGSGARIAAQLEADVKAGAVGVGEIMKGFGLFDHKTDGTRLHLDDPELDVVWETAARLKIPVFIHVGDPQEFWEPIDYQNERWLELSLYPSRRYQDRSRFPSFEELMAERDRLLARHPNTIWILAHMGWHANDLARLGRMLDTMPNLYTEVGAILYDLGRHQISRSHSVREGCVSTGRISLLLARVRDVRRVLRLLPRLPRLLEAVWTGSSRFRAEEGVLPERAEDRPGHTAGRIPEVGD
jgi:hypothetical protein